MLLLFNQKSYQPASKTTGAKVALFIVCSCFRWLWYDFSRLLIQEDFYFQKAPQKKNNKKKSERLRNIFYKDGQNPQTIRTAAISFFETLHSSSL